MYESRASKKHKSFTRIIALLILMNVILVIGAQVQLTNSSVLRQLQLGVPGDLHVIFFSIIIESLPFIVIGVVGSTLLELFVSPDTIRRLLPKTWFLGIGVAGLLGLLFPFCECGLVPIVRRLMQKGVPAPLAAVFLLAAPVVNPVVGLATHFAFFTRPEFVYWRLGGAYLIAVLVGFLLISSQSGKNPSKTNYSADYCGCGFQHNYPRDNSLKTKLANAFTHSQEEFFTIMHYLVIGAFLAATAQTFLPRVWLTTAGSHETGSVGVMMIVAFFLSLCSGADAFVANTFVSTFTPGSIVAFMVFGPMIDLKNTLMLLASFNLGFVARLVFWVSLLSFIVGVAINKLGVIGT